MLIHTITEFIQNNQLGAVNAPLTAKREVSYASTTWYKIKSNPLPLITRSVKVNLKISPLTKALFYYFFFFEIFELRNAGGST